MAYQMNNSLPSTDKETLSRIADMSVNYLRALKKQTMRHIWSILK